MNTPRSILFMEKVLLKAKKDCIRGVEVFNLKLIDDLCRLGIEVSIPLHKSWAKVVKSSSGHPKAKLLLFSLAKQSFINGFAASLRLLTRTFDILLIANVSNGLLPSLRLLWLARRFKKCLLIAHREPSRRFVCALRKMPITVIAVNEQIAEHFRGANYERVYVDYGVSNAKAYYPRSKGDDRREIVNFCVVGQLDNAWKGADTAISAFRNLPQGVAENSRLHLASFTEPPQIRDENIIVYNWMAIEEMPTFFRRMDIMLVPSRDEHVMRETFCQAMVQAMLCGLPVVANDLPILREKIEDGAGRIFHSTEELRDLMSELASNPELRLDMGKRARDIALERYIWNTERFIEKYAAS